MPSTQLIDDLLRAGDQDLFAKYAVIKQQFTQNVQSRWCARWAEGNDHGRGHIERVLANLSAILGTDPIERNTITTFELFLAATAVVAHDIGIIHGRKHHAERSAELLELIAKTNTLLFDDHSLRVLGAAIKCHSSHVKIDEGCEGLSLTETFVGHQVRPRFVAALVRLADELDEDRRRAEAWVQDIAQVPEASRPYWEFCQRIQGIGLDETSITFDVVFKAEDIGKAVVANKAREPFVRFFAKKVAKINREREWMKPYLGDLSRQRLTISVKPIAKAPNWKFPREFVFPNGSCMSPDAESDAIERFIRNFPELEEAQTTKSGPL